MQLKGKTAVKFLKKVQDDLSHPVKLIPTPNLHKAKDILMSNITKKYTKKPVTVEVVKVTDVLSHSWQYWPEWLQKEYKVNFFIDCESGCNKDWRGMGVYINTLEGKHQAMLDDYIIRGVAGEIYPCKSDIFDKTYEKTK